MPVVHMLLARVKDSDCRSFSEQFKTRQICVIAGRQCFPGHFASLPIRLFITWPIIELRLIELGYRGLTLRKSKKNLTCNEKNGDVPN